MRENRINWTRFFRPVCVLCMVCGGLWLWWQMSLTENLLGRITAIAGGVLFLLGGLFGLLGKPRALVPLLDFLALAAALIAPVSYTHLPPSRCRSPAHAAGPLHLISD